MVLLVSLLIGSLAQAGSAPPGSIGDHVDASLVTNAVSQTYSEWKESGYTPEDIFARVERVNTHVAWGALCDKLSSLRDDELALFEHEISAARHATRLRCLATLEARLKAHWAQVQSSVTEEAADDGQIEIDVPQLPSEVRVIDASNGPVLIDGHLAKGEIALTFDDGPHPTRTQKILKTLEKAGIRATFFEVGEMAKRNPQLSKLVLSKGHTVGSHSWSHPNLPRLPLSVAEHNILLGHDSVMTATGVETPFFRFPYGAHNSTLQSFVQSLHMASFYWNLDSLDWKLRNPAQLYQNVLRELDREKGGIILFHDIQEQTTIVLPKVLRELKRRGFKTIVFVPQTQAPTP